MSRNREWQIVGSDTAPVVTYLQQRSAAARKLNLYGAGAAIYGVFEKFLERGGGPFYDLASHGAATIDARFPDPGGSGAFAMAKPNGGELEVFAAARRHGNYPYGRRIKTYLGFKSQPVR